MLSVIKNRHVDFSDHIKIVKVFETFRQSVVFAISNVTKLVNLNSFLTKKINGIDIVSCKTVASNCLQRELN